MMLLQDPTCALSKTAPRPGMRILSSRDGIPPQCLKTSLQPPRIIMWLLVLSKIREAAILTSMKSSSRSRWRSSRIWWRTRSRTRIAFWRLTWSESILSPRKLMPAVWHCMIRTETRQPAQNEREPSREEMSIARNSYQMQVARIKPTAQMAFTRAKKTFLLTWLHLL